MQHIFIIAKEFCAIYTYIKMYVAAIYERLEVKVRLSCQVFVRQACVRVTLSQKEEREEYQLCRRNG